MKLLVFYTVNLSIRFISLVNFYSYIRRSLKIRSRYTKKFVILHNHVIRLTDHPGCIRRPFRLKSLNRKINFSPNRYPFQNPCLTHSSCR